MKTKLIIFALTASILFSACGAKTADNYTTDSYESYAYEDVYYAANEGAAAEEFIADTAGNSYSKAVNASVDYDIAAAEESGQTRMVRKSASITITVADPTETQKQIAELAEKMGGFVVSSSTGQDYYNGDIYLPRAYLTIRVPAEQLNEMLDFIESQTADPSRDVQNKTISGVDITAEYVDTNSRLTSLEKTLTKLYEILDTAETAEETMLVYADISSTEQEIEVLKGQIKYMEESVALSSIDITIKSVRPEPTAAVKKWQPGETVKSAFESLLETGKDVIDGLIYFFIVGIPVLIIIAIPVLVIVWLVKKLVKAIRGKKEAKKAKKDNPEPPIETK